MDLRGAFGDYFDDFDANNTATHNSLQPLPPDFASPTQDLKNSLQPPKNGNEVNILDSADDDDDEVPKKRFKLPHTPVTGRTA